MIILAYTLSGLSLLMSALFLVRPKVRLLLLVFLPLTAGALSPIWATMGAVGALLGWAFGAPWAVPMGIVGAITMILYVWRCTPVQSVMNNKQPAALIFRNIYPFFSSYTCC